MNQNITSHEAQKDRHPVHEPPPPSRLDLSRKDPGWIAASNEIMMACRKVKELEREDF
jgi:hypothetical protein